MKAQSYLSTYRALREQPLWKLLASDSGPAVLAILQANLYDKERTLPASLFFERVARDLEELRAGGETLGQSAQAYVASWLTAGYLVRRFPAGATEEEYELSVPGVEAIRFASALVKPHSAATESRLAVVMDALTKLAEDTDADKEKRVAHLLAERIRIEEEIERIRAGDLRILPLSSALERARDIINLADELAADFRRVRDDFERLNRDLRQKILDDAETRGAVLHSLFSGIDLIAESEAGRTFSAFWRLLMDRQQTDTFDHALEQLAGRDFLAQLQLQERRFLRNLPDMLLEQGGAVHDVFQNLARSLKNFVASREYLEQRRLHEVLKEAQRAGLELKNNVSANQAIEYWLDLTSCRIRSLSQWSLYDPTLQTAPGAMTEAGDMAFDLEAIGDLVARSEIDFRSLKEQVSTLLERTDQATIADVLEEYPAKQGLGTIVGLVALATRFGRLGEDREVISWVGEDNVARRARIPKVYFLKERAHELV